ncbi:hypothetical protein Trydic_g3287 [Trypoxylus dichotomus]
MPLRWTFEQYNDRKHTSKAAKAWRLAHRVNVMVWPVQSPDLKTTEHVWGDIRRKFSQINPSNHQDLNSQYEVTCKSPAKISRSLTMATSSTSPEEPNSPEDAITSRKCSESERNQPKGRDSRETVNDTNKISDNVDNLNINNNNLAEIIASESLKNSDNRISYNNNEVPHSSDINYFQGGETLVGNTIGNPNKKFLTSSTYRPSSVPAANKYQIRHEKESSRNKSSSENSLPDMSFPRIEEGTKSNLPVKQTTDNSIGGNDLDKKTVVKPLPPPRTPEHNTLKETGALHGEKYESSFIRGSADIYDAKRDNFASKLLTSQGSYDVTNEFRNNCDNSISKTIENNDEVHGRTEELDDNSIVTEIETSFDEHRDNAKASTSIESANISKDIKSTDHNENFEISSEDLNYPTLSEGNPNLEKSDNVNIMDVIEIDDVNTTIFMNSADKIPTKLELCDNSNRIRTRDSDKNNCNNREKINENIIVNNLQNVNYKINEMNLTEKSEVEIKNLDEQDDLNIINLNLKETLDKFDEKISSLHFDTSDASLSIAKERKLRFRKCYSDSKTCSKIYPIYENVNNVKNSRFYGEQTMECLNVKNLEKVMVTSNRNAKEDANQKYKCRKSYHQDVEEALSSLLWQPYEYQNVYNKNSDIQSSSSLSSSSSGCSSSSSSCSTISSRGSFRRDLERSNNGPVHRQQSARNGNTASDLHLRTEMVNNPAANGYENLLSQWRELNGSRDAAELSNASRLMVGVSPEVPCLRAVASLERSAYVFCDCDACLSDMRLEVCEDVTPLTSSSALAHEISTQPVSEASRSNNVTLSQSSNQQHLPIGAVNSTNMQQQQPLQRSIIENNYQRNSLSSVNVVGLPRPIPSTTNGRPSGGPGNSLFANHPRNASEPITMVQSNQFKYTSNIINASNVVPILSHQRHSSQIESGNAIHPINHMRSASVPKTVPHATQKMGESRSGSDLKVIVGNEQQQQNSQQRQQRLPLNVSNVNVNYYRAVPVNVVSSVPAIQCVNSGDSNVSNVNIVQAMPVVNNTPNNCTYTTCTSSTNYVQNYANLPPQGTQQNFSFTNPPFSSNNNNQMQIHPPPLQQCAITTFGSSIITQHFPSGSTYNLSTPPVPNNVQINTTSQNIQQSTQTHISYQNSNENNVIQNSTIVVPSVNHQQPLNSHTFSTTEVTVHNPPMSSQIQIVPPQATRPPLPPTSTTLQEVRTRTFTSTEAQTDETAVNNGVQNDSGANREQRRRERRERRHHRRVNSTNHRHGTNDHGTQWNSLQNERLPDILNSHMPPSYATAVNNGIPPPQPVLPNAIVSNPIVPPGAVVQTMVPNNIVPSGIVGNPIVPFPPPVVPGQVPLVQGAAPVPVPVPAPSGFRFPFPAAGFRR